MNTDTPVSVRVTQEFEVPPEAVFDAWITPEQIGKWMFGPAVRDEELLHVWIDAQVGGRFSYLVRRQGKELDHVGTWLEMSRPDRLAFTWGVAGESEEESRVFVDILPRNGGSELTLTQEMQAKWADYAKTVEGSWLLMLSTLYAAFE